MRLEGWPRAIEIGCCRFRRSSCRSRQQPTSGAVHPSFETAAEPVIGPAEGRTRWRPPQDEGCKCFTPSEDEVSTYEVRTIKRPHPEQPTEGRRLEGWTNPPRCPRLRPF